MEQNILDLCGIVKKYGSTMAADHLDMHIRQGEVLGLVGANGAGKSTLMRIISGVTMPDDGTMEYDGQRLDWKKFTPVAAGLKGIRVVYQELSLCDNLKVYENFYVELRRLFKGTFAWRKRGIEISEKILNEIFPGHGINVKNDLSDLSIAQQQMVEIARAFADPDLKLLILDEPTSSLPVEQTRQLLSYIKKRSEDGITFIYITHRLFEIMEITNRIYVLTNGRIVDESQTSEINEEELIKKMGTAEETVKEETKHLQPDEPVKQSDHIYIKCRQLKQGKLENINCSLSGGEVIGIGGLEGNGQKDLLKLFFQKNRKRMERSGSVAYVTGNRKEEGNFPLWSVSENLAITAQVNKPLYRINSPSRIIEQANLWIHQLKIKGEGAKSNILNLSGGNQQKVLIARSLLADADIIILDDPTRGVDVETKQQLYGVFREAAQKGKLVIWYSSDDSELMLCSRVLIMRYGTIVKELSQGEIHKNAIIEAAFTEVEGRNKELALKRRPMINLGGLSPFLSMAIMYVICGLINKSTFSIFGAELLISGSLPLILATISQVFIIGLSQVNLGIGNFMGLVSVIIAAVFYDDPLKGSFMLLGALFLYACMGLLIYFRNIPAVIVTLGSSFVWTGMALVLQDMPGGHCPEWLVFAFNTTIFGIPSTIVIAMLAAILAILIYRSKYGTVMRGFGNREKPMVRSGWSKKWAYFVIYICSGIFGILGGIAFTAITYSADAQAMDSYTLLTVAAVVLGGGDLNGGRVNHLGAVFGAVTLSLVTILLGFLHVNTDFTAAVQGLLLIIILSLRLLKKGGRRNEI